MEARDSVDRILDLRPEGLGFDSQCWSCVKVLGKLRIPHCLVIGPSSPNRHLVHKVKVGSTVAGRTDAHSAREKVKSVEHVLSQLSLP